ncbi:hypothetical protein RYJ27_06280 [Microbacterium limosum]|uniref:DUF4352 domain-containing protein n=1 Tax=Microbacterium limosum TaxID=3079935 RepID=A0AAU0MKJ0_9MICO|nr:hypothetical protein [Microbacterium sp. Y20]WOQ70787.1 hypothetical protein RYJ27_06280 [Microbacterium sp. Y20]
MNTASRLTTAGLLIAAALSLSACSGSSAPLETPEVEAAGATSEPTPAETPEAAESDSEVSQRGNLIKGVGVPFGATNLDNEDVGTFVVTAITVDPECTGEYAEPAENGHLIRFDVEGETTAVYDGEIMLNEALWKAIAENGTTFNGSLSTMAAYSCLPDNEMLPVNLGPGERVRGSLIFDVPTPTGVLVLDPWGSGGWEWTYPSS